MQLSGQVLMASLWEPTWLREARISGYLGLRWQCGAAICRVACISSRKGLRPTYLIHAGSTHFGTSVNDTAMPTRMWAFRYR